MYRYCLNSSILFIDPLGLCTGSVGISGSVTTPSGWSFNFLVGVAFDGNGHVGGYTSYGGGLGVGAGGGIGANASYSDAKNIADLKGPFNNMSAGAGDGLGVDAEGFIGTGSEGQTVSGNDLTVGGGLGGGVSTTVTNTNVYQFGGGGAGNGGGGGGRRNGRGFSRPFIYCDSNGDGIPDTVIPTGPFRWDDTGEPVAGMN